MQGAHRRRRLQRGASSSLCPSARTHTASARPTVPFHLSTGPRLLLLTWLPVAFTTPHFLSRPCAPPEPVSFARGGLSDPPRSRVAACRPRWGRGSSLQRRLQVLRLGAQRPRVSARSLTCYAGPTAKAPGPSAERESCRRQTGPCRFLALASSLLTRWQGQLRCASLLDVRLKVKRHRQMTSTSMPVKAKW